MLFLLSVEEEGEHMAKGTIYESSGSFYVRYSVGMTLSEKSGKPHNDDSGFLTIHFSDHALEQTF